MGSMHTRLPRRFRLAGMDVAPGSVVSLLGAPLGSVLTDGSLQVSVTQARMAVDISRWRLSQLELQLPAAAPLPALRALVLPSTSDGQQRKLLSIRLEALEQKQLLLQGLPTGAVLTDGVNLYESIGEQEPISVLHWNLAALILLPPKGWHREICLRVEPQGMDDSDRERVSCLRIRLMSANAFLKSRLFATEVPVDSEFTLDVGQPQHEPKGSQLTIRAEGVGSAFTSPDFSDTQLDEAALQLLEAKFRLH